MRRLHRPRITVRGRLTLLYGGLFLACGAALLAITYLLVDRTFPSVKAMSLGLGGSQISGATPGGRPSPLSLPFNLRVLALP
jgi:hypothetical protein